MILYAPYCAATVNPSLHSLPTRITRTTMIPVQPKPKLETLDDLLAQAEHYANYSMRTTFPSAFSKLRHPDLTIENPP